MNIQNYLDLLQMETMKTPDLSYLEKLHERHLLTVPFENLDIRRGIHINLDQEYLFDKVIIKKRGGLCFEINLLFAWLLEELGYQVNICSSGVYDASKQIFGPKYDHMVLCVYLKDIYLVDVAFGDCFRLPISITKAHTKDVSGRYRIVQFDTEEDRYELQKLEANKWLPVYYFSKQNHQISDFMDMADSNSNSNSYHRKHSICSIATDIGRITMTDDHLTITENAQKIKTELKSETQFCEALYIYFGIDLGQSWNDVI